MKIAPIKLRSGQAIKAETGIARMDSGSLDAHPGLRRDAAESVHAFRKGAGDVRRGRPAQYSWGTASVLFESEKVEIRRLQIEPGASFRWRFIAGAGSTGSSPTDWPE